MKNTFVNLRNVFIVVILFFISFSMAIFGLVKILNREILSFEKVGARQTCADVFENFTQPGIEFTNIDAQRAAFYESPSSSGYTIVVTYLVENGMLTSPVFPSDSEKEYITRYKEDVEYHTELWNDFLAIAPESLGEQIAEVDFYTDGSGESIAYIAVYGYDPIALGMDLLDMSVASKYEIIDTYIHEIGHLVTLGPSQIYKTFTSCAGFSPAPYRCSEPDAYITEFYDRYWADIYEDWLRNRSDLKRKIFIQRYGDEFITNYAATNINEDMAETWVYFILAPEPNGDSIPEEKIRFYYEYEELVALRTELRTNICAYFNMPVEKKNRAAQSE